jgi:hypothetical protein
MTMLRACRIEFVSFDAHVVFGMLRFKRLAEGQQITVLRFTDEGRDYLARITKVGGKAKVHWLYDCTRRELIQPNATRNHRRECAALLGMSGDFLAA